MRRQTQLEGFQVEGNSSAVVGRQRRLRTRFDERNEQTGPFFCQIICLPFGRGSCSIPQELPDLDEMQLEDWSTTRPAIWVERGVSRTLECSCELRFSHEVETAMCKHDPCFLPISSRMTPSENLLSVQTSICLAATV